MENTTHGDSPIQEVDAIPQEELRGPEEVTDAAPASIEDESQDSEPSQIDYKKQLEKLEKQLGQAEYNIQKAKEKSKSSPEADPDALKNAVREVLMEREAAAAQRQVETALSSISNPDERKLVEKLLETTIRPSGNPLLDIQNARALANNTQLFQENEELKRAANKVTSSDSLGSNVDKGTRETKDADTSMFTKAQLERFKFAGIDPSDVVKKAQEYSETKTTYGQMSLDEWKKQNS